MAYEPKTWACGDVVTADALNKIEQGIAEASSGGGTSLVTNKYELGEVTMQATKQGAALNLSQPIALSKIRALWVATANTDVVGGLVNYNGNLSADQVYQIQFQFVRGSEATLTSITFNPVVYITMEE